MRKILALMLTAIMVLTSVFAVFSEDEASVTETPAELNISADALEAADFLYAIGVLDESDLAPDNIKLKRGTLAKLAVRIFNMGELEKTDTGFRDVNASHEHSGYISMAENLGLINGFGDGKYAPNNSVSYTQLIKVMVEVLGYGKAAAAQGGYPDGYLKIAKTLALLQHFGVANEQEITLYEAVLLIRSMLETKLANPYPYIVEPSGNHDAQTLLKMYFDIERFKGIVSANYYMARDGEPTGKMNEIRIGDSLLSVGETAAADCFGETIAAYAKEIDTNEYEIVWVKRSNEDARRVIDCEDLLPATDAASVCYLQDSAEKRESIPSNAVIIKNGEILSAPADSDFNVENGCITLVSSDGGRNDTVIIEEYTDLVVKSVYDDMKTIGLKNAYNGETKIEFVPDKRNPRMVLTNWDGSAIELDDIEEDDVLSVASSSRMVKIVRSNRCVVGKVEEISDEYVVVDGEQIKFSGSVINTDKTMRLGLDAIFSLNYRGQLVWIGDEENLGVNAYQYGYMVGVDQSKGMKPVVSVKLFTQRGNMTIYTVAEKLMFNGVWEKDSTVIIAETSPLMNAEGLQEQLIRYRLNEQGEINEISVAKPSEGMGEAEKRSQFTRDYASATEKIVGSPAYMFASRYLLRNSTYVFKVPEKYNGANDREYQMASMTDIEHNDEFPDIALYDVDVDTNVIGALVTHASVSTTAGLLSMSGVIAKKGTCLDADGAIVNYFDVYNNAGRFVRLTFSEDIVVEFTRGIWDVEKEKERGTSITEEVEVDNNKREIYRYYISAMDLEVGDVIQYEANSVNELTALAGLLRAETRKVWEISFQSNGTPSRYASFNENYNYAPYLVAYGPVYKLSNYGFTTAVDFRPWTETEDRHAERTQFFGEAAVLLYDTKDQKVSPITWEDIRENEDMAFIHRENRDQKLIVIYR